MLENAARVPELSNFIIYASFLFILLTRCISPTYNSRVVSNIMLKGKKKKPLSNGLIDLKYILIRGGHSLAISMDKIDTGSHSFPHPYGWN